MNPSKQRYFNYRAFGRMADQIIRLCERHSDTAPAALKQYYALIKHYIEQAVVDEDKTVALKQLLFIVKDPEKIFMLYGPTAIQHERFMETTEITLRQMIRLWDAKLLTEEETDNKGSVEAERKMKITNIMKMRHAHHKLEQEGLIPFKWAYGEAKRTNQPVYLNKDANGNWQQVTEDSARGNDYRIIVPNGNVYHVEWTE